MKKSRVNWTLKRFNKEITNNVISFDYPIQRAGGQWDLLQKSLLVHSVACDYPIPPLYALAQIEVVGDKSIKILYILDGKQRLTNLRSFILGDYRLDENTPIFNIDGQEYNLAKHKFDELPENVQDAILDFTLDIFNIEEATDEEIEDMFFRLNNGTPLSSQQKAKAKMGADSAIRLQGLTQHPLMEENAVFTELQKRKADDEVALVQSMMLLDKNYTVGKFGTKDVFEYTTSLREGKDEIFATLEKAMDFLSDTLGKNAEKTLLKKLHMPFVLYASHEALEKGLSTHTFKFWIESFKEKLMSKTNGVMLDGKENGNAWLYKMGCGAGATKAEKVDDRWSATKHELQAFYKELEEEQKEEAEQQEKERVANEQHQAKMKAQAEKTKEDKSSDKPNSTTKPTATEKTKPTATETTPSAPKDTVAPATETKGAKDSKAKEEDKKKDEVKTK